MTGHNCFVFMVVDYLLIQLQILIGHTYTGKIILYMSTTFTRIDTIDAVKCPNHCIQRIHNEACLPIHYYFRDGTLPE